MPTAPRRGTGKPRSAQTSVDASGAMTMTATRSSRVRLRSSRRPHAAKVDEEQAQGERRQREKARQPGPAPDRREREVTRNGREPAQRRDDRQPALVEIEADDQPSELAGPTHEPQQEIEAPARWRPVRPPCRAGARSRSRSGDRPAARSSRRRSPRSRTSTWWPAGRASPRTATSAATASSPMQAMKLIQSCVLTMPSGYTCRGSAVSQPTCQRRTAAGRAIPRRLCRSLHSFRLGRCTHTGISAAIHHQALRFANGGGSSGAGEFSSPAACPSVRPRR